MMTGNRQPSDSLLAGRKDMKSAVDMGSNDTCFERDECDVECNDSGSDEPAHRRCPPSIYRGSHELFSRGQPHQRNEGERDPKGEDHLTQHQGIRGVGTDREHDDGRDDGDQTSGEEFQAGAEETAHDIAPSISADSCRGETGGQECDREHPPGRNSKRILYGGVGTFKGIGARYPGKNGRSNEQHHQVDGSCDRERDRDIDSSGSNQPRQRIGLIDSEAVTGK